MKPMKNGTYEGICEGGGSENYKAHLNMEHPRKSTCTCSLANCKMVICKHIVAVSLCVDDSETESFRTEKTIYTSEEDERRAKKYDKYMSFAKSLSAKELREAYVELMIELDEKSLKVFDESAGIFTSIKMDETCIIKYRTTSILTNDFAVRVEAAYKNMGGASTLNFAKRVSEEHSRILKFTIKFI